MFISTSLIWLIAGTVLLVMEFVAPGVVLLFFGIGAWGVAVLVYFFAIPIALQLLIFLVLSLASLFSLRRWVMRMLHKPSKGHTSVTESFVGATTRAHTPITEDEGSVNFRGTYWQARTKHTEPSIASGERVRIVAAETTVLIVEKI